MASPILRGGNLIVTEQGIREGVRQALLPLWNAYSFLQLYAERPATWRTDSDHVLDRYILARLGDLVREVRADLEGLDSTTASARLRDFAEVLLMAGVTSGETIPAIEVGGDGELEIVRRIERGACPVDHGIP